MLRTKKNPHPIGPITRRAPQPACWRHGLIVLVLGLGAITFLDVQWDRQEHERARGRAELLASDVALELTRRLSASEATVQALASVAPETDRASQALAARSLQQQAPRWFRGLALFSVCDRSTATPITHSARDSATDTLLEQPSVVSAALEHASSERFSLHALTDDVVLVVQPVIQAASVRALAIGLLDATLLFEGAAHAEYHVRDGGGRVVQKVIARDPGTLKPDRVLGRFTRTIHPGRRPWFVEVAGNDDSDPRLRKATFWIGVIVTLLLTMWVWGLARRRRQAQSAARLYRNLFEVASELVFVLDDYLRIRRANDRAEQLLGPQDGRRSLLDVLAPADRENARATLLRALNGATTEFVASVASLRERRFRFRVVPVLIQDAVLGIQVLAEDITEKQALEQEVAQRRDELEKLNTELYRASITDGLTGVYNRRHLGERADQEVSRALRYGRALTCLFVDLDHFKRINDTYGHGVGDEVLRSFADLLVRHLRRTDIVGRYGGEEFVVLLTDTELGQAQITADKLLRLVRGFRFPALPGHERVTTSIGAAAVRSGHIDTTEALFHAADEALYEAKRSGRDRLEVHAVLAA